MSDFLTISNANELIRIPAEGLAYIESEGNYSDIHTCDGGKRTVTVQLGILEEMIHQQFLYDLSCTEGFLYSVPCAFS